MTWGPQRMRLSMLQCFGWSWRVPHQEAQSAADCADVCPCCSAEQEETIISHWIPLHEYIWSPQYPFNFCHEVISFSKMSAAVSIFALCSSDNAQKPLCLLLEAFAAACQSSHIQTGERETSTFCYKLIYFHISIKNDTWMMTVVCFNVYSCSWMSILAFKNCTFLICCYKPSSTEVNCPAVLLSVEICPSMVIILLSLPYQFLSAHRKAIISPAVEPACNLSGPIQFKTLHSGLCRDLSVWPRVRLRWWHLCPSILVWLRSQWQPLPQQPDFSGLATALCCVCMTPTCTTHLCHLDSCGSGEQCTLQDGVRSCVLYSVQTCAYTPQHIATFDHTYYDFHGTCRYQLVSLCRPKQSIDAVHVYAQSIQSAQCAPVNACSLLMRHTVKKNWKYWGKPRSISRSVSIHKPWCNSFF